MAESAVRVVAFREVLAAELETGCGFQGRACAAEGGELFVDDGLVDLAFVHEGLRHVDFILVNHEGRRRIGRGVAAHEVPGLLYGGLQGREVAGLAVAVLVVQVRCRLCQSADFRGGQHLVVEADAVDERVRQVAVGREGGASDPGVGHRAGEVRGVGGHVAHAPLALAVQIERGGRAVLGVHHVDPASFLRLPAEFDARLVVVSAGGDGEALGVQSVGRVFPFRGRAGRGGGEGPEEVSGCADGGVLVHAVVHGEGVGVQPLEKLAGLSGQVQVARAVPEVEYVVFAHFHHLCLVVQCGGDAGRGGVRHGGAAGVPEVEVHEEAVFLGGGLRPGCRHKGGREPHSEMFAYRFHLV